MFSLLLAALAWASPLPDCAAGRAALAHHLDVTQAPPPEEAVSAGYTWTRDLEEELLALATARPGAVCVELYGRSLSARPLWAVHITEPGVEVHREVLVFAGLHALEWIGTEVALTYARELAHQPLRGVRVTIAPLTNPDGRHKAEADLRAGRFKAYRRGNAHNTDLNRDWAVNREAKAIWRHVLPGYYATTAGPLSEPETQALDALAARHRYDRAVSLHSFGGFLYYPWAGRWERLPADHEREFLTLGRAMEQAQGAFAYRPRPLGRWGFFFRAHGAEVDHLYETYGTRSFLIELTRSGIRGPKDLKTPFRWYNPRNPDPHLERGLAAVRTLATHPDVRPPALSP